MKPVHHDIEESSEAFERISGKEIPPSMNYLKQVARESFASIYDMTALRISVSLEDELKEKLGLIHGMVNIEQEVCDNIYLSRSSVINNVNNKNTHKSLTIIWSEFDVIEDKIYFQAMGDVRNEFDKKKYLI